MKKIIILFVVVIQTFQLQAQDKKVRLNDLSKQEKKWALRHPVAAKKAKKIVPFVRLQVDKMISEHKTDSFINGGQADAFRHALWMALTAKKIGEKKSRQLGQLHEKANKEAFYNSKKEDLALQDSVSCQMDLSNNEIGIGYGIAMKKNNDQEIIEAIYASLMNGELYILFRNKKNELLTCDGEVIKYEDRSKTKTWYVPYCLTTSNNTLDVPTR